jgi:divalent metal cation (Fe/Co/Zn/Cd) transporter
LVDKNRLLHYALILSIITITYNMAEGLFSTILGYNDETLALFGFGVDSFIEVISGMGIFHMILQMKKSEASRRGKFERQALYITSLSFFILTIGLIAGAIITIINKHKPETTIAGIIISSISILSMLILMLLKLKVGKSLNSAAIISDAKCTQTCFYLSFILLASSLIYEIFSIPYIDAAGSTGIAVFAFKEGREAFLKAKSTQPGN